MEKTLFSASFGVQALQASFVDLQPESAFQGFFLGPSTFSCQAWRSTACVWMHTPSTASTTTSAPSLSALFPLLVLVLFTVFRSL